MIQISFLLRSSNHWLDVTFIRWIYEDSSKTLYWYKQDIYLLTKHFLLVTIYKFVIIYEMNSFI